MSSEIRPFEIDVPQAELEDLHRRLAEARWPDDLVEDWSRGVPSAYLQELVRYWRDGYDWRTAEAELNEHSQFLTEVDGQTIHFLRIRSRHEDALPLLLLHGYPGSIVDFQQLIGPLTDGDGGDAFHLVIPSLPGYGFSTPLADRGWEAKRSARAMAALMGRLGYDRYGIHGFDIGAGVAGELGGIDSSHVLAVHVTTDPGALALLGFPLSKAPEGSSEGLELERLREYQTEGVGYLRLQSTRPQTLAYSLTDSPVGQLAWIVEKFKEWTNPAAELPEQAVDRDQLLTNVSIYWFTRSGASAAQFIYEAAHAEADWGSESTTPTGFAVFNTLPVVRRTLDADHNAVHWSEFREGGHFPAMEEPALLTEDIRAFFRGYRA
jgi:pimeloyl-ACP methyl ester carboxylesterase